MIYFTSNQEFEDRFQYFINALPNYQPAIYANSILSDQVCFHRLNLDSGSKNDEK